MKTIAILATAALVNAGTNKTLAPTPGIVRPNAPPVPPPITPFPTEPNVVRIVLYIIVFVLVGGLCGVMR